MTESEKQQAFIDANHDFDRLFNKHDYPAFVLLRLNSFVNSDKSQIYINTYIKVAYQLSKFTHWRKKKS